MAKIKDENLLQDDDQRIQNVTARVPEGLTLSTSPLVSKLLQVNLPRSVYLDMADSYGGELPGNKVAAVKK